MRIRRCASRLLGSAYSAASAAPPACPAAPDAAPPFELLPASPPPPPPLLAPCSAPESRGGGGFPTASGEPCELSRSPWDLIAELSLSDPQVEDELVDRYFVNVACRASWLFAASMPATSVKQELTAAAAVAGGFSKQRQHQVPKKTPKKVAMNKEKTKKEGDVKKKPKVKEEEVEEVSAQVWKCKKNDGKRWHCHRTVSGPDTLCDYHFYQKRTYWNPEFASSVEEAEAAAPAAPQAAASKPSTSSKPRRKKKPGSDVAATEGFYYYAGFGPFRTKRHCRGSGTNDSVPPVKQEEEEEQPEDPSPMNQAQAEADNTNRSAAHNDESGCDVDTAGIAGLDEGSSDDDGFGAYGHSNGKGNDRATNGDSRRSNPWKKRWRKPVKARSLKSLM
ncbi:hypothetical protein ACP70R_021352 [Stipagrostis hirtigluma subsp. patula]